MDVLALVPELRRPKDKTPVQVLVTDEHGTVVGVKDKRKKTKPSVAKREIEQQRQEAEQGVLDIGLREEGLGSCEHVLITALEGLAELDEKSLVKAANNTVKLHKPFRPPPKRVINGFKECMRAVKRGETFLVIVANDIEDVPKLRSQVEELLTLCATHGTPRTVFRDIVKDKSETKEGLWTPVIVGPSRKRLGSAVASPYSKRERVKEIKGKGDKKKWMTSEDKLVMAQCSVVAVIDPYHNITLWKQALACATPVVLKPTTSVLSEKEDENKQ